MKIKIHQLVFLLLTLPFCIQAQDISATPEIFIQSSVSYNIIGDIDGVPMILFEQNGFYKVRAFDENMSRKWERDLKFEKRSAQIVGFIAYRKYFNVFYKFKHKGRTHLRVRKLDNQLKIVDSTLVKLFPRRAFTPEPDMVYSKNKNKILFTNSDNDSHIEALVFDNKEFKTTRDLRFNPPNFSYREDFLEALVDNKGGFHIVNERDNKKSKQKINRLEFITFLPNSKSFRIYNASFNNYLWFDLNLTYDNRNERILVGGFCSERTLVEAHATFFMSVNPKNEKDIIMAISPFTPDFLTLLLGRKLEKNIGFGDVSVREVIARSDGGMLMIAERNRRQIRSSTTAASTSPGGSPYGAAGTNLQTDYYFNEILMFSFNPNGQLHWEEILHKKQFSQDDGGAYSSYFLFFNKSNLKLLYNDTIRRGDTVYEYEVNSKGNFNRNSLFNTTKQKLMLRMSNAIQISGNELLVPSERRSQLRLVKLTF